MALKGVHHRRLLSSSGSDTASRHSLLSDTPVWVDSHPRLLQLRGGKYFSKYVLTISYFMI
nr:MAG TPA: hypothetical protein [Caudoviricetes sp.]